MKNPIFTGAAVAIITPMNEDGTVNYDEFAKFIDFQIENGTDAIVVCDTTGESSTLKVVEHNECIRWCVEYVNHRVPVIAGTGSNSTLVQLKSAKRLAKTAQTLFYSLHLTITKQVKEVLLPTTLPFTTQQTFL